VVASYRLTFGASLRGALVNVVFGFVVAWVLVRYRFAGGVSSMRWWTCRSPCRRGRRHRAHRALRRQRWFGALLAPLGVKVAFTPLGVFVALTFIGLPFVVRTVQPVLESLPRELEEAATTLGASRFDAFRRVVLPVALPSLITGFALAFARAIGEYGSVIFIAGNMPMVSEITPLLIITKLEQYDYTGATAIAVVMLVVSFVLLLAINALQAWTRKRQGQS
jgi:sulfate transport system permease protein